tara:strand:- start:117 stop:467 length:351 start_codon:yes stop_codon:yes gene_type:complete
VVSDKEIGEKVIEAIRSRLPEKSFSAFNEVLIVHSFISFSVDRLGLLAVKMAKDPDKAKELDFWQLMDFIVGLIEDQAHACTHLNAQLKDIVKKNLKFEQAVSNTGTLPKPPKTVH